MRLLFALFVFMLAGSATAQAASLRAADRNSSARLLTCDVQERSAVFQGNMRAFGRAVGLSMRFTLQVRDLSNPVWRKVEAPNFGVWLEAAEGKSRYVYDKEVENLQAGADYRAVVRFRWRDADGAKVARARARTRACRQPDTRPNLLATRITASSGSREDTRFYAVRVVNEGNGVAAPFSTDLIVAGTPLDDEVLEEPLAPGQVEVFEFEGPVCKLGDTITATVDSLTEVDESDETDNRLTVPCPPRGRTA